MEAVNTPVQNSKPQANIFKPAVLAIMTALIVVNLVVTGWLLLQGNQKAVAFDMKGTLDQFMEQSAGQTLTEPQSEQLVARFGQALDDSLEAYQQEHQVVILVAPSVVLGAPDITRQIQQDIAARMRSTVAFIPSPQHEGAR